jgi:hypothetical protein
MTNFKRKKLIVDIGHFKNQKGYCGIYRVTIEILRRLIKQNLFDIVLIDSLYDDESTLRNFRTLCDSDIPFQGKYVEHYVLPIKPTKNLKPTFLGRLEDRLTSIMPNNVLLRFLIDIARAIKWKIKPPLPSSPPTH